MVDISEETIWLVVGIFPLFFKTLNSRFKYKSDLKITASLSSGLFSLVGRRALGD